MVRAWPRALVIGICKNSCERWLVPDASLAALPRGPTSKKTPVSLWLTGVSRLTPASSYSPTEFPCSTIGSDELNFRVRDGIGCGLVDIDTGEFWASQDERLHRCACVRVACDSAVISCAVLLSDEAGEPRPDSGLQLECLP